MEKKATPDFSNVFSTLDDNLVTEMVAQNPDTSVIADTRNNTFTAISFAPENTFEDKIKSAVSTLEQKDIAESALTTEEQAELSIMLDDSIELFETHPEAIKNIGKIRTALESDPTMSRNFLKLHRGGFKLTAFAYDGSKRFQFGDVLKYKNTEKHEAVLVALTSEEKESAQERVIEYYSAKRAEKGEVYTSDEKQKCRKWLKENSMRESDETGLNHADALTFAGHFRSRLISHEENETMSQNNKDVFDTIWTWLGDKDLLKIVEEGKSGLAPRGIRCTGEAYRYGYVASDRNDLLASRVVGLWVQIA